MKNFIGMLTGFLCWSSLVLGQPPAPPEPADLPVDESIDEVEPLMRGPIHEAFAEPIQLDVAEPLTISEEPPPPVEEVPPETDSEDEGAQWIPGYWSWDDEQEDFIWISGVWRKPPQGRQWIPGSWQPVGDGYRWSSGWWAPGAQDNTPVVGEVLPAPPASLELGPTSDAPSDDHFWIPGSWQYREQRYVWRPGFWSPCYDNWVWVPDYYVSNVSGCYYVPGYWDYGWERRGVLYAPCRFHRSVFFRPGFVHRPSIVVDISGAFFHLWARPNFGCYYFGDYYDDYYLGIGYRPWYSYHRYRSCAYDPLFVHYHWRYRRDNVSLYHSLHQRYGHYRQHRDERPVRTYRAVAASANRPERGRQQLVHQISTRDRLASNVTRRDQMRRELISPTDDRLRGTVIRERPGQEGSVARGGTPGRGRPSSVVNAMDARRETNQNPARRGLRDGPSQETVTNSTEDRPSRTIPNRGDSNGSQNGRPERQAPAQRSEILSEMIRQNSVAKGRPSTARTTGRSDSSETSPRSEGRPSSSRSRIASSATETSRPSSASSRASQVLTPARERPRGSLPQIEASRRESGTTNSNSNSGRVVVPSRSAARAVERSTLGNSAPRTVNRPVAPSSGRSAAVQSAPSPTISSRARDIGTSAPSRSAVLSTARSRLSSSASAPATRAQPATRAISPRSLPPSAAVRAAPRSAPSASRSSAPSFLQRGSSRGSASISQGSSSMSRGSSSMSRGSSSMSRGSSSMSRGSSSMSRGSSSMSRGSMGAARGGGRGAISRGGRN